MVKAQVSAFLLVLLSLGASAQSVLPAALRSADSTATPLLLRQPDSRLVFFAATGGGFYSDRLYANGDKDDAYNGIRSSKTLFTEPGRCKTRTAMLDKWNRVVVAGHCRRDGRRMATMVRLGKDGSPDAEFEGMVQPVVGDSSEMNAICILPDEKIMIAGTAYTSGQGRFFLSKHIYNGARDAGFGTEGVRVDAAMTADSKAIGAVAQWDGRIVVCGYAAADGGTDMILVRYNTDGGRDQSYGTDGMVTVKAAPGKWLVPRKILALPGDKAIVLGTSFTKGAGRELFVAMYGKDGKPDTTFGKGGMLGIGVTANDRADDIAILPEEGGFVVSGAGAAGNEPDGSRQIMLRLSVAGKVDSTWGYGSKAGIKAMPMPKGQQAAGHSIAVAPLDARVYCISEMVAPGSTETIVTLKAFLPDADLGILDMADRKKQYLVYPIPVREKIAFQYEVVDSQYVTVKIYNGAGKEVGVINKKMKQEGEHSLALNLPAELPPGRYEAIMNVGDEYETIIEITKQ